MSLETYVVDVIEGRRWGQSLFYLLSFLYRLGVSFRQFAYKKKWIEQTEVAACVVSIGNIVAGGTGKTPLVQMLAKELISEKKVAILSRGYRAKIEKSDRSIRVGENMKAAECGDEPLLLAKKFPGVAVWSGRSRSQSAHMAAREGAEVILLDDGMQHRRLKRDFELVVMNGDDLFGRGYFLPRGYLRESPRRLADADLIVVTGVDTTFVDYDGIEGILRPYTDSPVVAMRMRMAGEIAGIPIGVFCAIGNPSRFLKGVKALGGLVVAEWVLPDHAALSTADIREFALRSKEKGAQAIVCTEKDEIKLPPNSVFPLPLIVVKADLEIIRGRSHWSTFIQRIKHERKR